METIDDLLDRLPNEGVEEVSVTITAHVTIRKRLDEEASEGTWREVRTRPIPESEIERAIEGTDWKYSGEIDVLGDYYVKDRLRRDMKFDLTDDDES